MNESRRHRRQLHGILASLAACASLLASGTAQSQGKYPTKPLTIINPFGPGSNSDVVARILINRMQPKFGQPVVMDYKTGGGGVVGYNYTARATPDGHTIVYATASLASSPGTVKDLPYDPIRDFAGITLISEQYFALIMRADQKGTSFPQFVENVRKDPEKYTVGGGSGINLALFSVISQASKASATYVPYGDLSKMYVDLGGGRISAAVVPLTLGMQMQKGGQAHMLAVSSPQRLPQVPDLQTMQETLPGVTLANWSGFFTAAKAPREAVNFLHDRIAEASKDAEFQQRVSDGGRAVLTTPEETDALMRKDVPRWLSILQAAGIKPQ